MKKKNDDITWKEGLLIIAITLLIVGLFGWGLYTRGDKINKTCSEKINELKGFENCTYIDWQVMGDEIYKCICIENHQIKEFAMTKAETKK